MACCCQPRRCPVLTYLTPGSNIPYGAISPVPKYRMVLSAWYATSGTDIPYGARELEEREGAVREMRSKYGVSVGALEITLQVMLRCYCLAL
eukprot:1363418-Rhodomonas_salina.1